MSFLYFFFRILNTLSLDHFCMHVLERMHRCETDLRLTSYFAIQMAMYV